LHDVIPGLFEKSYTKECIFYSQNDPFVNGIVKEKLDHTGWRLTETGYCVSSFDYTVFFDRVASSIAKNDV